MPEATRWDAAAYETAAVVQLAWGRKVLARRKWRGDETVIDVVVPAASTAVAEFSKLLENVFRNVNIALVN